MLLPAELLIFLGMWLSSYFFIRCWTSLRKEKRRYPPSLPSLPLVGSLPFIGGFNNIADSLMKKSDQLGPFFTFRAGSNFVLVLNSKNVIEDALVNRSSAFSGRSSIYTENIINPNSKGMVTIQTTKEWKKYHQLSLTILKELGFGIKSTMESRILTEVEFLTSYILNQNGESFNPSELVHLCTTNIMANILFGRRHNYELGTTELAIQVKRAFDNFVPELDIAPLLRFLPFHRNKLREHVESQKEMHKIIGNKIRESLESRAADCFVCRYIERLGQDYDADQLNFTLRDFIAAGTDTTANTVLWTMIALANNPDVQDRLRAEIDYAIPRKTLPSMNDQPKLPFVEATILEILRWKTLVPLAIPHMTLSDTTLNDYFIPSGTLVLVNLYAVHMDPRVWKDPEAFRPERFLDKEGQVIRREFIIPFSLGRRACLGEVLARAELFLILTGLVQRFVIRPPEGQTSVSAKPIEPVGLTLAPSKFNIRLIARD